jgi:hypothetical protein
MAFDALLYRLLVIGEAVKALPTDLLDQEPDVPWSEVARLAAVDQAAAHDDGAGVSSRARRRRHRTLSCWVSTNGDGR